MKLRRPFGGSSGYRVSLSSDIAARIPDDYVSLTIDTSLVLGGRWWGPSRGTEAGVSVDSVEALDLRDPRLEEFAALLYPAMLRIGGTEADRVDYRVERKSRAAPEPLPEEGADEAAPDAPDREYVLKRKLWKRINAFARKSGFRLLFVVSAGHGDRDASGAWLPDGARALVAATAEKDYPVAAWEFGNEVNGYPFILGWRSRVSPARYVADFSAFARLVRGLHPDALVAGPASAVWPVVGEPNPIIPALCRSPALGPRDPVTWHYYPQQSSRGRVANRRAAEETLLNPRRLDSVRRQAQRIVKAARGRPVWMTETGHALYGGEPGLSDTQLSSLWWLDQLGVLALSGMARVFRQALVGADYGLLDQETFAPRPDFYATFLWKRLMGAEAYAPPRIDGPDARVRAYLHSRCGKKRGRCLLLINLRSVPSSVVVEAAVSARYAVAGADGSRSRRILLNGIPVEEDLLRKWGKGSIRRKYLIDLPEPIDQRDGPALIDLAPRSYAFLELKDAEEF